MTVFQGRHDTAPCLYVATWSPHLAHSPDLLRTEDGVHFAPVQRPPFGPTVRAFRTVQPFGRSEEHTSELQSLMRNSYAVFCLKKKKQHNLTDGETTATRAAIGKAR